MPRIASAVNETGRRRTERYREAQARKGVAGTRGRPEASHVDRALAAAVAVACRLADPSPEMQSILRLAKDILKREGYDTREAKLKIQSRVLYRRDLPDLLEISRSFPRRRLAERHYDPARFSRVPHYFTLENQESAAFVGDARPPVSNRLPPRMAFKFPRHHPHRKALQDALEVLRQVADRDADYAMAQNGEGFSKSDSSSGHMLSQTGLETALRNPQTAERILRLAARYKRQVLRLRQMNLI